MDEQKANETLDLANSILIDLEKRKIDPVHAYAALGCAFQQLHKALGHSKQDWIDWTIEMAEIASWKHI